MYPYRDAVTQATLEHMPHSPYDLEDKPFLSTQRYSVSANFDPQLVADKAALDAQGAADNLYWINQWRNRGNPATTGKTVHPTKDE
jgi:hypothetical protein